LGDMDARCGSSCLCIVGWIISIGEYRSYLWRNQLEKELEAKKLTKFV
jgi:hypothetical protein